MIHVSEIILTFRSRIELRDGRIVKPCSPTLHGPTSNEITENGGAWYLVAREGPHGEREPVEWISSREIVEIRIRGDALDWPNVQAHIAREVPMADGTKIEWSDATWNPVTGCSKVSAGCANCYAERWAARLDGMGVAKYRRGFRPTCHFGSLAEPDGWRRPRRVFVCSMGDLFHEAVPFWFIERVFETMERNDQHVYQLLTKRADRLAWIAGELSWPPNVWIGVSVEDDEHVSRIAALREIPARVRFVSLEPLLGPVPSLLTGLEELPDPLELLDWIIVGGESGRRARPMPEAWPARIRDAAVRRGIPFFFKQHSEADHRRDRFLEGRLWDEFPSWTGRGGERES